MPRHTARLQADDLLSRDALQASLGHGRCEIIGRCIRCVEETGSTNTDLMQAALAGAQEGTVLIADRQHSGRGRLGRRWHTVPGALACSVLLRPAVSPSNLPQLSLLAAVALQAALRDISAGIAIKWPNDILHQGAKLAGILTEARTDPGCAPIVVLGFGINVSPPSGGWHPDIQQAATDLSTAAGHPVSRCDIAVALLKQLDQWYLRYMRKGFEPVRDAWWRAHVASGRCVRAWDGRQYTEGIARALDADGALLLETSQGIRRVIAGELTLI